MGMLEQTQGGRRFSLGSGCLLGRNPKACDLRVEDQRVSSEHASLHWTGEGWELRDLGSRNGTFLEGRRLASGERVAVREGQRIQLGHDTCFQLVDASPPAARARHVASQRVRESSNDLLLLPDDEEPRASLFLKGRAHWVLETGEEQRAVADQERLWLEGEEWVLELPAATPETLEGEAPTLGSIHLRIGVSRDEEHVEVTLVHGQQNKLLSPRAYHYLLATLARVWLQDQGSAEPERGWVDRETLCRMLATDGNKLNVDIHRVRKQLSSLGIQDAANVVERRPVSGHVRLGARSVEVFAL
jgi:pSer/pThr/pTyr-binding forkhead associated (FHA) protein